MSSFRRRQYIIIIYVHTHALVRAEQSRVTSFRLGVTWHGTARQPLSQGSLDPWMALGLYYIYKL